MSGVTASIASEAYIFHKDVSRWADIKAVCTVCDKVESFLLSHPSCETCNSDENVWVCLLCGVQGCGRYNQSHAVAHWQQTFHNFSLELGSNRIWSYLGDIYVHRIEDENLSMIRQASEEEKVEVMEEGLDD